MKSWLEFFMYKWRTLTEVADTGTQHTEVVLTAHPTQVNRRTLQHKHCRIAALLAQNDR